MKRIKTFKEYLEEIEPLKNVNSGKPFYMEGIDVTKLASDIIRFAKDECGIDFGKNYPRITFSKKEQDEKNPIFTETGRYTPEDNSIVIFTENRFIKDCLRSMTHELVHADQYINKGIKVEKASNGIYGKSKKAEFVESDAYKRGNLIFRKWEESIRIPLGTKYP